MTDFVYKNLNDVTTRIKVGFVGSVNEFYCDSEAGVPIIRTTDIDDINFGKLKFVTKEFHEKNKKSQLKNGDLIIARHGDNGNAVIYRHDRAAQVLNAVIIEPDQSKVTSDLLKIFFDSPFIKKQIKGSVKGSVQGVINTQHVSDLVLNFSDTINYDFVIRVITNLNRKLELNNKINAELEAMTKLIYDYWFVQFDFPDENGKPYKSSGGKMVFNEVLKKEIPYGWKVQDFGVDNEIRRGNLITSDTIKNGKVKLVSAGVKSSHFHDQANRSANVITISSSGANAGYVNFWREPIFASDCITVQATSVVETVIAFQFLKMIQNHIYRKASGSAQPHVYTSDLFNLKYLLPPKKVIDLFERKLISSNDLIGCQNQENDKLKELRDWLLPMLMNGQVTVSETS